MYLRNTLQICSKITSNQFIAQFHLLNVIKSKKKTQQLYIYMAALQMLGEFLFFCHTMENIL